MTPRERYLEPLLFGRPARIPFRPGGPRESTRAAWEKEQEEREAAVELTPAQKVDLLFEVHQAGDDRGGMAPEGRRPNYRVYRSLT